jgi:hypothetical protein
MIPQAPLAIVEDAVLAALATAAPTIPAAWSVALPATQQALTLGTLTRAYVAQHQDGGGRPEPWLGAEGWTGLVVLRCLSGSRSEARAGLATAITALEAATSGTAKHTLRLRYVRPLALPTVHLIETAAGLFAATVRRVP